MQRTPNSHKGENGKVAVIGGSRHMHGAPLFSLLAAEATGVDLLFACVPACHAERAKAASLNVQVHPFHGDDLGTKDREQILQLLATMDVAVVGPGIAHTEESVRTVLDIIAEATCTLVLDATALQSNTLQKLQGKPAILTPHLGELERMGLEEKELRHTAEESHATILLKGPTDRITGQDGTQHAITGGNAGLTVGGTGDALAGLIAGLVAQGEDAALACIRASTVIKEAGNTLLETQGFAYTTTEIIARIPRLLAQ